MEERRNRFLTLLGLVAVVCVAVVLYDFVHRLPPLTLSLSIGVVLGALAVLAPLLLAVWLALQIVRWRESRQPATSTGYTIPPVVVTLPQQTAPLPALPAYGEPLTWPAAQPSARGWTVIGEE